MHQRIMRNLWGLFSVAAICGPLQAALVIYEPFNYPAGGLDTQGGPAVGLEGAWNASSDTTIVATSLEYGTPPNTLPPMGAASEA